MKRYGLLLAVLYGLFVSAWVNASILPPNTLHLEDNPHRVQNITEEQFNGVIDAIVNTWRPLAEKHGARLDVTKAWKDSTVNAYAQQSGDNWSVHFFGGLARRKEVTLDGFALVVCHELGHHFGGYAFYGDDDWAASEGQSDYWATQVCARKIWAKVPWENARHFRFEGRSKVQAHCERAWKDPDSIALCDRITDAGISLATLLGALGGGSKPPRLDTPDKSQVSRTSTSHPEAQCRLDTYVAGAICPLGFDLSIIPGKDDRNGNNSSSAEATAAQYSCMSAKGYEFGFRPRCWFKPQITKFFRPVDSSDYYSDY